MKLPVPKKLPSGSWRCQVRVNGTSRSVTEPTYDLCLARAMAIKSGLIHEKKNPKPITLGAACDAYISMRRGICSPTTLDGYQKIREQHFQGIMNKQISKIDEHMLSMAVSEECRRPAKRGSTLAPKTVRSALSFVIKHASKLCFVKFSVMFACKQQFVVSSHIGNFSVFDNHII